ncbi:MAG: DUF4229 domain-containing protein [Nocardioidaceae bacterium]|nr:DUF4229 domain-containing protein [Nocardioidaceae bacterium]NUS49566.1 DUF4229 domain-containing protein [Nocardioidaceae bacterium]
MRQPGVYPVGVKEFWVYTLARIGLFVASFAVILGLWVVLVGSYAVLWALVLAAVVSAVASYYLLQGPRQRFAAKVEERASRMTERFEAARAKEDED